MMWFDANDSNSFTLSGSNVTALSDKSGSGTAVTTFTGTVTWSSNGLNSRPTFDLTSGNFRGTLSATTVASNYTHSLFCVTRLNSAAGAGSPLIVLTQPETSFTVYYRPLDYSTTGPNFRTVSFFATTAINTIAAQTTSPFLWTEYYEGDQTNNSIVSLSNGANQAAALAGAAPATSPGFFSVGTEWNSTSNWNRFQWPGTVSEIIIYNNILTPAQRQLVEGYLAWKWGLQTTNLPSTHPYRFAYPFVRPFIPPDAGQCEYWFDAADTETIAASGTTLTTWSNKGTTVGSNATTNAGTITTGSVSQQNGLNVVGINSASTLRFTAAFPTQVRSRFFAVRPNVNTTTTLAWFLNQAGTGGDGIVPDANSSGRLTQLAQSVAFRLTGPNLANQSNTFSIVSFRNAANTARNRIAYNGSNQTLSTNTTAASYIATAQTVTVGVGVDVGEWISYNSQLNNTENFQVEGYLAWKWGLRTLLPSDHIFRNVPPVTPAFVPTLVPNCQLWLDGADPAGTGTAPANGTAMSTWVDKSGTGWNISQATVANQPTYDASRRALSFVSGSNNYMERTGVSLDLDNYTIFLVVDQAAVNKTIQYTGILSFRGASARGDEAGSDSGVLDSAATGNNWLNTWTLGNGTTFVSTVMGSNRTSSTVPYINTMRMSNLVSSNFVDGDSSTCSNLTFVARGTTTRFRIGARTTSTYTATNAFTGNYYEMIFYNRAITFAERQVVEGYLAWKWRIQSSTTVPSIHPYKRVRP